MVFKSKPVAFQTYLNTSQTNCGESRLKTCFPAAVTQGIALLGISSNWGVSDCPCTPTSHVLCWCTRTTRILVCFRVLSMWPPRITFPWQPKSATVTKWGKIRELVIILGKCVRAYEVILYWRVWIGSFWRSRREMAEVSKQLSFYHVQVRHPCKGLAVVWEWEVWLAWFWWRLMPPPGCSCRSQPVWCRSSWLLLEGRCEKDWCWRVTGEAACCKTLSCPTRKLGEAGVAVPRSEGCFFPCSGHSPGGRGLLALWPQRAVYFLVRI